MWFSQAFMNAERCAFMPWWNILPLCYLEIKGTRRCPEDWGNMLQPNSWHSTLQEANTWLSVRNTWGLTRQTYSWVGKMGQPSAVQLAKAEQHWLDEHIFSLCLLRAKFLVFLSAPCNAQPCVSRTNCPQKYYFFLSKKWINMSFASKIIYFEKRKKNSKFCTARLNLKCVEGVV